MSLLKSMGSARPGAVALKIKVKGRQDLEASFKWKPWVCFKNDDFSGVNKKLSTGPSNRQDREVSASGIIHGNLQ